MSNFLSIAAVTAALKKLLEDNLEPLSSTLVGGEQVGVTAYAPTRVRGIQSGDNPDYQLNLYLYQTELNAAWRNQDLPTVKTGESAPPPLALNLHYLLSAYGPSDEINTQKILGLGMSIFNSYPILDKAMIRDALGGNDLYAQVERIKLAPLAMSLEEISKLWSTFQTAYQISAIYQVSVVLIENMRTARTPLPVLSIGANNRGIISQPSMVSPYAEIRRTEAATKQPAMALQDFDSIHSNRLIVTGANLKGNDLTLSIKSAYSDVTLPYSIVTHSAQQVTIDLGPNISLGDGTFPAGAYSLTASVSRPGSTELTNAVSFAVAPQITSISATGHSEDGYTVSVISALTIFPQQSVVLLIGSYALTSAQRSEPTETLEFEVPAGALPSGLYPVRLRVDGIDTLLVDRSKMPPVFKTNASSSTERFQVSLP